MKKKIVNKEAMKETLKTLSPQEAKSVRGGTSSTKDAGSINIGIRITF